MLSLPEKERRRPGRGSAGDLTGTRDLVESYSPPPTLASIPSLIALHLGAAHLAALAAGGAA